MGAKGVGREELKQQVKSLKGATIPNGQKCEDWVNAKERREEGVESE